MEESLPIAFIYSSENFLSKLLADRLTSEGCGVYINEKLGDTPLGDASKIPSYLFLIQGFGKDKFFSEEKINEILKISETYTPKTQIILPYMVLHDNKNKIREIRDSALNTLNRNLGIIYLGEVYGPDMDKSDGVISDIFSNIQLKTPAKVPQEDFDYYSIGGEEAVKQLTRGIFSYGFNNKEIVISNKVSFFGFIKKIKEFYSFDVINGENMRQQETATTNAEILAVNFDEEYLKKTVDTIISRVQTKEIKMPTIAPVKIDRIPPLPIKSGFVRRLKRFLFLILFALWILAFPFLTLFLSGIALTAGFNSINSFDLPVASFYFSLSHTLAIFSKYTLVFDKERRVAAVTDDFTYEGKSIVNTLTKADKLKTEFLSNKDYDLESQARDLSLGVNDLYEKTSFLLADLNDSPYVKVFLNTNLNLEKTILYLDGARVFANKLTEILGQDKQMTYVVAYQDINQLMPTGGVINSFDTYTFDKGKLIQKNSINTSDLDSKFKGQIDPPLPLTKYLGMTNWPMKFSNWDPDFSISGAKFEWFLNKEAGQNVDGVIAINPDVAGKLKNFNGNFLDLIQVVVNAFDTKDLQIFMNNNFLSKAISNLNWDSESQIPQCSGNCDSNYLGLVEANLGQNSVNQNISRNANLNINYAADGVVHNVLNVTYQNSSSNDFYKAYVRILAPSFVSFPDSSPAENLVFVPERGKTNVTFSWNYKSILDLNKPGRILLKIRKQSGVTMPVSIVINGSTRYNTSLSHDENYTISW